MWLHYGFAGCRIIFTFLLIFVCENTSIFLKGSDQFKLLFAWIFPVHSEGYYLHCSKVIFTLILSTRIQYNTFQCFKLPVCVILLTQNTNIFAYPLCFLTLSESAPSSLLSDFQPVLPLGPFGLQTGATAAASLPQVATICCATLPALPFRRRTFNAHR